MSSSHVVLTSNTSFSVVGKRLMACLSVCLFAQVSSGEPVTCLSPPAQMCSGWSEVTWVFPEEFLMEGVVVENRGSSSLLQIFNASWQNSGRYTCEEASSDLSKAIDVFIPGEGESSIASLTAGPNVPPHHRPCPFPGPLQWFVPQGSGVVMKETEEDTIPCVVSDPRLNVSLYERPDMSLVTGMTYEPARGFTGPLNDISYECVASAGDQKATSKPFYVFSIIGEVARDCVYRRFFPSAGLTRLTVRSHTRLFSVSPNMEVDLTVSSHVLKRGDVLTVNCTVKRSDVVYFTWEFPRRQVSGLLTGRLSLCMPVCLNCGV